jgi:hypothetical protein
MRRHVPFIEHYIKTMRVDFMNRFGTRKAQETDREKKARVTGLFIGPNGRRYEAFEAVPLLSSVVTGVRVTVTVLRKLVSTYAAAHFTKEEQAVMDRADTHSAVTAARHYQKADAQNAAVGAIDLLNRCFPSPHTTAAPAAGGAPAPVIARPPKFTVEQLLQRSKQYRVGQKRARDEADPDMLCSGRDDDDDDDARDRSPSMGAQSPPAGALAASSVPPPSGAPPTKRSKGSFAAAQSSPANATRAGGAGGANASSPPATLLTSPGAGKPTKSGLNEVNNGGAAMGDNKVDAQSATARAPAAQPVGGAVAAGTKEAQILWEKEYIFTLCDPSAPAMPYVRCVFFHAGKKHRRMYWCPPPKGALDQCNWLNFDRIENVTVGKNPEVFGLAGLASHPDLCFSFGDKQTTVALVAKSVADRDAFVAALCTLLDHYGFAGKYKRVKFDAVRRPVIAAAPARAAAAAAMAAPARAAAGAATAAPARAAAATATAAPARAAAAAAAAAPASAAPESTARDAHNAVRGDDASGELVLMVDDDSPPTLPAPPAPPSTSLSLAGMVAAAASASAPLARRSAPATVAVSPSPAAAPAGASSVLTRRQSRPKPGVIGDGIDIRKSKLPNAGRGLFVTRRYAAGDPVTEYDGEVISHREAAQRQQLGEGTHIATLESRHTAVDGRRLTANDKGRGGGSFANDGRDLRKPNVVFLKDDMKRFQEGTGRTGLVTPARLFLVAKRTLEKDEEVYVSYGNGYQWPKFAAASF